MTEDKAYVRRLETINAELVEALKGLLNTWETDTAEERAAMAADASAALAKAMSALTPPLRVCGLRI